MKTKWNYLICRFLLLFAGISLTGCTGKKNAESVETYWILDTDLHTYGEQGVFYQENGYLRFMDAASGLDVPVCEKPGCSHSRAECPAYFEGRIHGAFWEGDKLYLLTDYGADRFGELYLYEASVSGEDRKKIAELGEAQYVFQAVFTERYIVFIYWNQYDENMKQLSQDRIGVRVYDRETGACADVMGREGWNARGCFLELVENEIYFACFYYDLTVEEVLAHETDQDYMQQHIRFELLMSDMEGTEVTSILQDIPEVQKAESISDLPEVQAVCEAGVFYTADGRLYLLDMETGVIRDLGTSGMGYPSVSETGILFGTYDPETREMSFDLYEIETGQMRPVAVMQDRLPAVMFDQIIYVYDYRTEDGNGVLTFGRTGDFLEGNTDDLIRFEK